MKRLVFSLLTLTLIVAPILVDAATTSLPTTGQTACYDSDGNAKDCDGTGQDGDIQAGVSWPEPRFTDNGDGTVTDELTGLMWLKDFNCANTAGYDPSESGDGSMTWQQALDFSKGINNTSINISSCTTSNHTDWRVPNQKEIESIIDRSQRTPAFASGHPFINIQETDYWSSTTNYYSPIYASILETVTGRTNIKEKTNSNTTYTALVRGDSDSTYAYKIPATGQTSCYSEDGTQIDCSGTGQDGELQKGIAWPEPRFTDNEDGTITDNMTGLMWLKDANCIKTNYPSFDQDDISEDGNVTWQHAINFIHRVNDNTYSDCKAGYSNWRLPNSVEAASLINSAFTDNVTWLNSFGFENIETTEDYWSSTTYAYKEKAATLELSFKIMISAIKDFDKAGLAAWQVRDGIPNIELKNGGTVYSNQSESINFGEITIGESSTFSITGTNTGSRGDLLIEQIVFSGTDADQFSLVDDCSNNSFEPSETCELTISFKPTSEGEKSAVISIPSNDHFDGLIEINLTGIATEEPVPNIVVTDEVLPFNDLSIGFGEVNVGTSSDTTTITVSNDGTADLELGTVGFAGNNIAHFDIENNTCFNTTLAPGEDCVADIYFHPLTSETISATFLIESNDPDSPEVSVTVAGIGISDDDETEEADTETDNDTEEETTDGTDEDSNDNTANPGNTGVSGSSSSSGGGCSLSNSNSTSFSARSFIIVLLGLFVLVRRRGIVLK